MQLLQMKKEKFCVHDFVYHGYYRYLPYSVCDISRSSEMGNCYCVIVCMVYIVSMEISKKAVFGELKDDTYHNIIVKFLYQKCIEGFEKKGFDMTYYRELIKKG